MDLLTCRSASHDTDHWARLAAYVASLAEASGSPVTPALLRRHLGTSDPVILHNVLVTMEFDHPHLFA